MTASPCSKPSIVRTEPEGVPAARLRAVQRAVSELRRGVPVLVCGKEKIAILAVETADIVGLQELASMSSEPPILILSPVRATAFLGRPAGSEDPVAVRLPPELRRPELMREIADPSADQTIVKKAETVPAPATAVASLRLLKLARLLPAALAVRFAADSARLAQQLGLICVSARDVMAYRGIAAGTLRRVAEAAVPLEGAENCRVVAFRTIDGAVEHLAIVVGKPEQREAPLVRLHSECFTGDLLGSLRCDCGMQLRGAIRRMAEEGAGVVLYLAQEGRGIGLPNKLRAYALQDCGLDTLDANQALGWEPDERSFQSSAAMLIELGLSRIRLLTNNPNKVAAMRAWGVEVVAREPHAFPPNGVNDSYLATKARRFGHLLE